MSATIMIVDDDPAINSLISHQLRTLGYRTVSMRDGMQALQQLAVIHPDLVLLDVMMPHISGWDVCRQIRAVSDVPIIMLTAKDADSDINAGLGAGANDYIFKPYRIAQLQARIETVLRRPARRSDTPTSSMSLVSPPPLPLAAPASDATPQGEQTPQPRPRLGATLRDTRLGKGISLYQAEQGCRVRWDYLQAIEAEEWEYVPATRRRAAVVAYAAFLGVRLRDPRPRRSWSGVLVAPLLALMVLLLLAASLYLF